jgi:hypothetical protein
MSVKNKITNLIHVCPDTNSTLNKTKGLVKKEDRTRASIVFGGNFRDDPRWRMSSERTDIHNEYEGITFCPYCAIRLPDPKDIEKMDIQ